MNQENKFDASAKSPHTTAPRVDDEQSILTFAERVLSETGYEVATASDAAAAVSLADRGTPFDLFVESMLRRLLSERIAIELGLADDLNLVMADGAQLEHLIINLAVNARDAMPQGGRLRIATENVDLDENHASAHPGARVPAEGGNGAWFGSRFVGAA
jgi:signal transduction histidine kinase